MSLSRRVQRPLMQPTRPLWLLAALLATLLLLLLLLLRKDGCTPVLRTAQRHQPPLVPLAPSLDVFERLQASPALLAKNPEFYTAEFEAAPWLLPARTPSLPWTGMHGLDELMGLRAQPVAGHEKAIALLFFNKPYAVMAQNSVYSLVKFGGVRNYVVVTWTPADLEACADLNLPCADVSSFLAERVGGQGGAAGWGDREWLAIVWLKPALLPYVLEQGYVAMMADADIAYTAKPVWESYLAFMGQVMADGAFQHEDPVNGGHFVMLPTPAATAFAHKWAAMAPLMIEQGQGNQAGLRAMHLHDFFTCSSACKCFRHQRDLTRSGLRDQVPVFRTFPASHERGTQEVCSIGNPAWLEEVDPCDWQVLFIHAICTSTFAPKEGALRTLGFWFVDNEQGCSPQGGSASGVPACHPLQWRLTQTEGPHYACPHPGSLALVHGAEPAAVLALQAGMHAQEEAQLLDSPYNATDPAVWCY